MRRIAATATLVAASGLLSGCIAAAAAIPLGAAATMGGKQVLHGGDARRAERGLPVEAAAATAAPAPLAVPGSEAAPAASAAIAAPAAVVPVPGAVPSGMQYLYGSGEAAALSIQAYQSLWVYLSEQSLHRRQGMAVASVVLSRGATLAAPTFESCGTKPLAVVFDIDETVLLNLGYEADDARRGGGYDDARWRRWEATGIDKVTAVPGAVDAIAAARRAGVTVIYNSNRSVANAGATMAALDHAGLGPTKLGETLWLRDDAPGSLGKDERRWRISAKYCVIALVGDQLGDFSDLFNAPAGPLRVRRNAATETLIAPLWGAGWFVLPNPVYGTGLKGDADDIFPAETRWSDPAQEK